MAFSLAKRKRHGPPDLCLFFVDKPDVCDEPSDLRKNFAGEGARSTPLPRHLERVIQTHLQHRAFVERDVAVS